MLGVRIAPMCAGRCLTTSLDVEELLFEAFVNICGVNIPTMADFKLPSNVTESKLRGRCHNHLLKYDTSWLQHTTAVSEKSKSFGLEYEITFCLTRKKISRFVRKILAVHSLTHQMPKVSNFNDHWGSERIKISSSHLIHPAYISDDSRQKLWEVESTFSILMLWTGKPSFPNSNGTPFPRWCISSDLHFCQCQWKCLDSTLGSPL